MCKEPAELTQAVLDMIFSSETDIETAARAIDHSIFRVSGAIPDAEYVDKEKWHDLHKAYEQYSAYANKVIERCESNLAAQPVKSYYVMARLHNAIPSTTFTDMHCFNLVSKVQRRIESHAEGAFSFLQTGNMDEKEKNYATLALAVYKRMLGKDDKELMYASHQ